MKISKIFGVFILVLFLSCSNSEEEKNRFIETQKEILILRSVYPDTGVANPKILKVYEKYGFTRESFREKYFEYTKNPEEFLRIQDSAQAKAKRELLKLKQKEQITE
jgi:ribosomal protein S18 acetylase RimI-like enzyme